jgi:ribosome biogenesis GTPase
VIFLFIPQRAIIEEKALEYERGNEILKELQRQDIEVKIIKGGRVSGIPGKTEQEMFYHGKNTLVVGVRKESEFQTCKPSAHYMLPLVSGCSGMCEYCYLNTQLGKRPYIKVYVNVDEILERKTLLIRPAVANVNQLVAVIAAQSPDPDFILLDKLLITAEIQGIKALICINKTDLGKEDIIKKYRNAYQNAGYTVVETSSKENRGFDELKSVLSGHITVFAGQSGVGKSTILNRIMNTMVMKTGSLSDKLERGKHTTRHAELVELEGGGCIVDTPGFSSYELSGIVYGELQYNYPEFEKYLENCRFKGCCHISEPDCMVKQAVEAGLIDEGRYARYVELYSIFKKEDWQKDMQKMKG